MSLETVISNGEEIKGAPRSEWMKRHGDDGEWLVLLSARHKTGLTLRELGKAMGGLDYSAVSVGIRRYQKKMQHRKDQRRQYKDLIKMLNGET